MSMSRQHYELIALAMQDALPGKQQEDYLARREQWLEHLRIFGHALAKDNPNFKPERFYKACGADQLKL